MGLLKHLFRRKEREKTSCSVVVVAAGQALRMEGQDKILHELGGLPVIIHSLRPFEESDLVSEIILVTRREAMVEISRLCKIYGITKVSRIMPGGENRTDSVQIGLRELSPSAALVAIHDGARPFVSRDVVEEVIRRASLSGAAAPGIPVKDTIKVVEQGIVKNTLPRESLYAIQTPQVFEPSLIKAAIARAIEDGAALTDDCAAVERIGFSVAITQGSEENIKITTPGDLLLGEVILAGRNWY